jgi:CRP/FNR family cyclic AMP-dependent transcriptional regulator
MFEELRRFGDKGEQVMNKHLLIETLRGIRFLQGTSLEHLEQIANIAELCDFDECDIVCQEGDVAESIYLVVFGRLVLEICTPESGCKQIVSVGPGEMLGWSSLSDHRRMAATARVTEKTRLARIDGTKLLAICDEDPRFGYEFMRRTMLTLAKRLTATWSQLSQVHVVHYLPTATSSCSR